VDGSAIVGGRGHDIGVVVRASDAGAPPSGSSGEVTEIEFKALALGFFPRRNGFILPVVVHVTFWCGWREGA